MSDERALRAAILAHPDEDTPRLMFADWLDENDRPDQAEFIRLQIERSHTDRDDPRWRDLIGREAELLVAAKHTWLRPYLPWTDIDSHLTVRRGLVELAGAPAAHLAPHVETFRELTTLLELHVQGYYHNSVPTEEEPPNEPPAAPARRGWVSGLLKRAATLVQPAPDPPHPGYLCRIGLAARPPGMRVRAPLGSRSAPEPKTLFLELLDPGATEPDPPLRSGAWTVLAWNPDVPDEWRLVGRLARALCLHTQDAPAEFYRLRVAARPMRGAAELTAWSGLAVGNVGPFWLRFHDGEPTERRPGFRPPADWLGGVSL